MDRALERRRARAESEVDLLIEAGYRVMRRNGYAGATVADVLAGAGVSPRVFYRHFRSKDELLLAMYERDTDRAVARLLERLGRARSPRGGLEVWLDEQLSLIFDPRRAARTALFLREAGRLAMSYPDETSRIVEVLVAPLVDVLARGKRDGAFPGADPESDARAIEAIVWALGRSSLLGAAAPDRRAVRAHVLRFCLPALEGRGAGAGGAP